MFFFLSPSVLPFPFLICDEALKKLLRFVGTWFEIAAVLIGFHPEYFGGWEPDFNPIKGSVSIRMVFIFVIISIVKITWDSRKAS